MRRTGIHSLKRVALFTLDLVCFSILVLMLCNHRFLWFIRYEGGDLGSECVLVVMDGPPDDIFSVKQLLQSSSMGDTTTTTSNDDQNICLLETKASQSLEDGNCKPVINISSAISSILSVSVLVMGNDSEIDRNDNWLMEMAGLGFVEVDGFSFGSVEVAEVMRRVFY